MTQMSLEPLDQFLPPSTRSYIEDLILHQNLLVHVTKPRKSRHGSFRGGNKKKASVINISGALNPYAFIITLIHEIAHLKTWQLHGRKVSPHGSEWKNIFSKLMHPLMQNGIFPDELRQLLAKHMLNPKASSSSDVELSRLLKEYDKKIPELPFIEDIPMNSVFEWRNGRLFQKKEKLRKRYKCIELKTNRVYLFNPLAEVKVVRN
ncbi:MAG: SprT-like domain-containing protein [Bacteroidetes bacterium]|nr:SprT-like domain-containing protein [Bacteroidota bacterium]